MMSKDQRVDDGRLEAEHGKLDYRDSTDDEEVKLLPHRRGVDEPDPPGSDIRDRIHNKMNGYSRQSFFRGLARSGT